MSTTFTYPSQNEIQAYMHKGQRERSAFVVKAIGGLFRALTGRGTPSAEIVPIPATPATADHDHRLAA